jgi:hypothetical protein
MDPRRAVNGEQLEPILPKVAEAQRAGAISGEHATVISRAIDKIPDSLAAQFAPIVEHALVQQARHVHPGQVAKAAEILLARIDPDGIEPRDEERRRRREFGIRMYGDGTGSPYGRLTAQACAVWHPILDALSAPMPSEDGERDERSAGQRRHDGLLEAGLRLLRSGNLPASGGTPVTVLVSVTEQQLRERAGLAETAHGDLIEVSELLRMADEVEVVPVVLDPAGGVLSYGRRRRRASGGQRLALAARDRGCSFPGCTRPPAWCEAHHVVPWNEGGPTDIANLCLVCAFHHREFEKRGWTVRMRDGVPEWIPPRWLDPAQQPRRNTAHHVLEIDVDVGEAA